jgi:capsular exopolysaccharide synthesis family protein
LSAVRIDSVINQSEDGENRFAVLLAHKWLIIGTLVVCVAATLAVTATLQRIYTTTSTLIIAQPGRVQSFDTAQANEEVARSYADILASPNFANQVASAIGGHVTGEKIQSQVTIQSVAQTQLLKISAEDPSPKRAKRIADTYAGQFVKYAPVLATQTKANVALADAAPVPTSPSRPKPVLYALAGAILGLAAGIALAFLRERFDIRIRSLDELASQPDAPPILADIPVQTRSPLSARAFAEAFRLLRTHLRQLDESGAIRSIAITSWSEGEGKSTVTSQLSLSLIATGAPTLAVDGDIQRATLQRLLGVGSQRLEPGFTDYLLGKTDGAASIHETRQSALSLMPAGRIVPNLSSVMDTPHGRAAFERLHQDQQMLVIDCPPLAGGADASTIASLVDGVILVVDLRNATTTTLRNSLRQLEAANATLLGIAANRNPEHVALDYYGSTSGTNGDPGKRSPAIRDRFRRTVSS